MIHADCDPIAPADVLDRYSEFATGTATFHELSQVGHEIHQIGPANVVFAVVNATVKDW
ncbi:MAG: hypothetical protein ACI9EF_004013 [Pseudohongiellaceae bacterium]|jgi:hypothetical protein